MTQSEYKPDQRERRDVWARAYVKFYHPAYGRETATRRADEALAEFDQKFGIDAQVAAKEVSDEYTVIHRRIVNDMREWVVIVQNYGLFRPGQDGYQCLENLRAAIEAAQKRTPNTLSPSPQGVSSVDHSTVWCDVCGGSGSVEQEDGVWICPCPNGARLRTGQFEAQDDRLKPSRQGV